VNARPVDKSRDTDQLQQVMDFAKAQPILHNFAPRILRAHEHPAFPAAQHVCYVGWSLDEFI
jgi:hypothetical protein